MIQAKSLTSRMSRLSARITSPDRWNRPWLYWVGAWYTLFTAYFFGGLFGDVLFGWLQVPFVPYWIQPENLFGAVLVGMFIFICFVTIDSRMVSILPTLEDQPEPFGLVSLCVFLLFIGLWTSCVIVVEALGGFTVQGGTQEPILAIVSYMLTLCGAVFFIIRISHT